MSSNFKITVYYEDTDFSGVVYHANYFKFIERARSEFIHSLGIDQLKLRHDKMAFAVSSVTAKFASPAHFGDRLEVETDFCKVGGASIQLQQRVLRKQKYIFVADVRLALVLQGRAIRIPIQLKEKLMNWTDLNNKKL